MSNFAFTTWILLLFVLASGLALGSLARWRFEEGKRTGAAKETKDGVKDREAGTRAKGRNEGKATGKTTRGE